MHVRFALTLCLWAACQSSETRQTLPDGSVSPIDASTGTSDAATSKDLASDTESLKQDAATTAKARYVFAHYMVAIRTYGGSIDGYVREIREAKAAGIDGFALNLGAWRDANYRTDVASLYEAAKREGSGFKLFLSPDMCCVLSKQDVAEMVQLYANHPAQLHKDGRVVVSGWGLMGDGAADGSVFWQTVRAELKTLGHEIFLIPHAWTPGFKHNPTAQELASAFDIWKKVFDGYFYFGAAMLPQRGGNDSLLDVSDRFATAAGAHDMFYMGPVSPQYWGRKQTPGRRYYEYSGGEGLENQWRALIAQNTSWVELVTWNDFDEATYLSPVDDVNKYWPYLDVSQNGYYHSHAGLLALNAYFIEWFHKGAQPDPDTDRVFATYRTQPKNSRATNDIRGPVTSQYGDVQDTLYVTTLTTSVAELRVNTAGVETKIAVPAGLHHERIPFLVGTQRFELWRNGRQLTQVEGPKIVETAPLYNFIYATVASP
jgi:glucan endo-1,3-alpha-glucosidase